MHIHTQNDTNLIQGFIMMGHPLRLHTPKDIYTYIYMYIHIYVFAYTFMSIHICIYVYVYTYTYMRIHIRIYILGTYTCANISTHLHYSCLLCWATHYVGTPLKIHKYIHIHVHTYILKCIYIYVYTCTYIYIERA